MRGVGFIAGDSLESIQSQWEELIDAEVDVILFDRDCLRKDFCYSDKSKSSPKKEKIWKYIEGMTAAQDMCGNFDHYQSIDDLVAGDTLVLTSLDVIDYAVPQIWENLINNINNNGIHLAILAEGFHSGADFGDNVIRMMHKLYIFGKQYSSANNT